MSEIGVAVLIAVIAFVIGYGVGNERNDTRRAESVQFWRDEFETAASEADLLRRWIGKTWPKWQREEFYRRLMEQLKRQPRCDCYCRNGR